VTRFVVRPQYFNIVGYSRSKMSDEEFRDLISENLTCRVSAGEDCGREMEEYLARCFYVAVRGLKLPASTQKNELTCARTETTAFASHGNTRRGFVHN